MNKILYSDKMENNEKSDVTREKNMCNFQVLFTVIR